jgi:S1-C subfamily serine protease
MEEQLEKKTQGIALGLVLVALVVAAGGYFYMANKGKAVAKEAPACPMTQVGEMLGVEVMKGQIPTASGGSGVGIAAVNAGGLAEQLGLQPSDVVVTANGTATTCPNTLLQVLKSDLPSKNVALTVERGGEPMEVVLPAQAPQPSQQ